MLNDAIIKYSDQKKLYFFGIIPKLVTLPTSGPWVHLDFLSLFAEKVPFFKAKTLFLDHSLI